MLATPRTIDPQRTIDALVSWTMDLIKEQKAPGFILSISGTDSILAFLVCQQAFANLGRPERVVGVHYGKAFPPTGKSQSEIDRIIAMSPSYNWVPRVIMPWLAERAPGSQFLVDNTIDYTDDRMRWASLFRRGRYGGSAVEPLLIGQTFWAVGTRNATEQELGSYSNISGAVSVQPIIHLWKSEVLKICSYLNVPQIAVGKSREADCECGRADLSAKYIEEVDAILMVQRGLVSPDYLEANIDSNLLQKLIPFVSEERKRAFVKNSLPHKPPEILIS